MMPSTSKKQEDFMRAVAKSAKFAKKVGVPQSVGEEFHAEDKKIKTESQSKKIKKRYGAK